jgi:hypothetical protein
LILGACVDSSSFWRTALHDNTLQRFEFVFALMDKFYRYCSPPVPALREVAEILAGQTLSVDVDTVSFAQHFPRYDRVLSLYKSA